MSPSRIDCRSSYVSGLRKRMTTAAGLLGICSVASAALTVSPPVITNAFIGNVDLTITGLSNPGQTVVVEKFFDIDSSGTITAEDFLVQRFKVTDGQVTSIGGYRNLNVPGDEDGSANSAIHTVVYLGPNDVTGRFDGLYLYRVSPETGGFSPLIADQTVTQQDYNGSGVTGKVMGAGVAQAHAIVLIANAPADGIQFTAATVTNGSGQYSLKLPPGSYQVIPSKSGFFCETFYSPGVGQIVAPGQMAAAPNRILTVSQRTVSGVVREDSSPYTGLGGVGVFGQTAHGFFSFIIADAAGNYTLDTSNEEEVRISVLEPSLPLLGMVAKRGFKEKSTGSVTGFNLDLPRAAALIHGTVKSVEGTGLPFADVKGGALVDPLLRAAATTDAAGNYSLAVTAGEWPVRTEPKDYVVPEQSVAATIGAAVELALLARPATAHLRGKTILPPNNYEVSGVIVTAEDESGTRVNTFSDFRGNFDLPVYGGNGGTAKQWALRLSQNSNPAWAFFPATFQIMDGMDVNNIQVPLYRLDSRLRGFVRDESNAPVGGLDIFVTAGDPPYVMRATTLANGGFDFTCFRDAWRFGLSDSALSGLMPQENTVANVSGDLSGFIFNVRHETGTFSGTVKNAQGLGISGIRVSAIIDGNGFYTGSGVTDQNGNYSLPAFTGRWGLTLNSADLLDQGCLAPAAQFADISAGNVTVNFVAPTAQRSYFSWKNTKFTPEEADNPTQSGPLADFDHDGTVNLMEYALNLDPKVANFDGMPVPGTLPTIPGWPPLRTVGRLFGVVLQDSNVHSRGRSMVDRRIHPG